MPDDLLLDDSESMTTTHTSKFSTPCISPDKSSHDPRPPRVQSPHAQSCEVGVVGGVVTGETQFQQQQQELSNISNSTVGSQGCYDSGHGYNSNGDGCHDNGHGYHDSGTNGHNTDDRMFYNHEVIGLESPVKIVQPLPQLRPPQLPSQHSREQLEILYKARGRQVEELTQQLAAVREDEERHVKILREKVVRQN